MAVMVQPAYGAPCVPPGQVEVVIDGISLRARRMDGDGRRGRGGASGIGGGERVGRRGCWAHRSGTASRLRAEAAWRN